MLARHPNVKKWVVYALNEETVLGAVRATEQLHIPAADVIGVGINARARRSPNSRRRADGLYGTIAVSSTNHGKDSTQNLVDWIRGGKTPPADTQTSGKLMTRANWQAVRAEPASERTRRERDDDADDDGRIRQRCRRDAAGRPLLALDGITVTFPGVRALDAVSLSVRAGEVHGLMGENGAGSRRCWKVLSGVNQPQAGTLTLNGTEQRFRRARAALEAGIAIIYQELHLVPELTVAENLMLGQLPSRLGVVDERTLAARSMRWSGSVSTSIRASR